MPNDPDWYHNPDPGWNPNYRQQEPLELSNVGQAPVSLWINGRHEMLPPNNVIHLPGGRHWQIKWERGPHAGTDFVGLNGGAFRFVPAPGGWDLRPAN